jgi:GTP-binding protein YchF
MLTAGIIGLPNAGKSTLYNSLSISHHAAVASYAFTTIEPNVGIVTIPDKRLDELSRIFNPPSAVSTSIEFLDIAGLVKGASKGEGLGNQFLSHIREVNAVVHIVRCFQNEDVQHPSGKLDPKSDIEIVETELLLKDLETLENRMQKTHKMLKSGDKKTQEEYELYQRLKEHLASGKLAKYFSRNYKGHEYSEHLRTLHLLTDKHVLYVANVDDKSLDGNQWSKIVEEIAGKENEETIVLSAEVESELTHLSPEERIDYMELLGIQESGLDKLIHAVYKLLGLITFFTVNEKELHAWTIPAGARAPQAAGAVHSDFEKGFIKAEVMHYDDIIRFGSHHGVKEHGLLHVEGKDYQVRDGDVIYFRFHV